MRELLRPPPLNQKIIEIITDFRISSNFGLERLAWEESLENAVKSLQPILVIMIDICGRSCGRYSRDFPKIRAEINEIFERLNLVGEVTTGRQQPGSDEVVSYIKLPHVLNQSPKGILAVVATMLNHNPNQMLAYVSGLYLPPGNNPSISQILATLDRDLNQAKSNVKGKKQGPLYSFSGPNEIVTKIKPRPPYPDFISTEPIADLRRWLESIKNPTQISGFLVTLKGMKELNSKYGMTQVDKWLVALSQVLGSFNYELIIKIGPTFMVLSNKPNSDYLKRVEEWLHQNFGKEKLIPPNVRLEIEPLSLDLKQYLSDTFRT